MQEAGSNAVQVERCCLVSPRVPTLQQNRRVTVELALPAAALLCSVAAFQPVSSKMLSRHPTGSSS